MPESTGYVVVWACMCTDAHDDPAALPERCPGHDWPRICPPVENTNAGPTLAGHACRETPCPTRPEETP